MGLGPLVNSCTDFSCVGASSVEQRLNPMHLDDRLLRLPPFSQQVEKKREKRGVSAWRGQDTCNLSHVQPSQRGQAHPCEVLRFDVNAWTDLSSSGGTPASGMILRGGLGTL